MNDRAPFTRPSRRELILGGIVAGAAGTAWAGMPRREQKFIPDGALEKLVPNTVGDWTYETSSGLVLPPADQLARLIYSQQVGRTYVSPDQPAVMLLMAYGSSQGGMLQIHRPEICYPASGFSLSDFVEEKIPLGNGKILPGRRFTARSDTRVEQVLYWTRIGNFLPVSWPEQRLAVMRSNLAGDIPDGLLARVSVLSTDAPQAQATLVEFVRTMLDGLPPAQRRMLVGA